MLLSLLHSLSVLVLLYRLPHYQVAKLQHVQNSAFSPITGGLKYDHITPMLRELHWLPVYDILTYMSLNGTELGHITDILELDTSGDDPFLLMKPWVRLLTMKKELFSWAAPLLWNALPSKLRTCSSVDAFRSQLKTFLCKQYFD